ncbi:MAG: heme exporter protein CcmB [Candidatus Accumulibacter sp.]|jgi:heme exporter protein B|nr:heme exporter protein CcmB [Accumulibacter sp.]
MLRFICFVVRREFLLALRRQADIFSLLFFFIVVTSLFPLGAGPQPETLRKLAPGALWTSAMLAALLSLPRLFDDDYRDGALEQYALGTQRLACAVFGKIAAHWLVFGLPLALIAPLAGLQFGLPEHPLWVLTVSLAAGTPALSGIGAICAALTLGLRGGRVLLSLLALPLYIPVLVFGAGAVETALAGASAEAGLSFLAALSLAGVFFAPPAAAAALRVMME